MNKQSEKREKKSIAFKNVLCVSATGEKNEWGRDGETIEKRNTRKIKVSPPSRLFRVLFGTKDSLFQS